MSWLNGGALGAAIMETSSRGSAAPAPLGREAPAPKPEQHAAWPAERARSVLAMESTTQLSVIVPTYEEAENVRPLCTRLFEATRAAGLDVELLLVDDDSGQGTADTRRIVEQLRRAGYNIHVRVREKREGKGLSSAVLLGLRTAKNRVLLVMDADLQHEPESVPAVAAPVLTGQAEFAVGSRNVTGGQVAEGWPLVRRVISQGATLLARPLTTCSDPMSGFFCLSRRVLQRAEEGGVNPMGYKIGLELMVRSRCKAVAEVGITFRDRCAPRSPRARAQHAHPAAPTLTSHSHGRCVPRRGCRYSEHGESKLTMKQNLLYLKHLAHLYIFAYPLASTMVACLALGFLSAVAYVLAWIVGGAHPGGLKLGRLKLKGSHSS